MAEIKQYTFKVEINLEITRAEVEHMRLVSTHHYDRVCKEASLRGGFIYGWRNHFEWYGKDGMELTPTDEDMKATAVVRATWRDMDILGKILEGERYFEGLPSDTGIRMSNQIRGFLFDMREVQMAANKPYLKLAADERFCTTCNDVMRYTASADPGFACRSCGHFEADEQFSYTPPEV